MGAGSRSLLTAGIPGYFYAIAGAGVAARVRRPRRGAVVVTRGRSGRTRGH
jgi:hypothetical protein